jgi:POT family proton-dependent oligopeptide transporter
MPKGISNIVGNEAAERFSFYGMKAILVIFMTQYLRNAHGELDVMSEPDALVWYHNFLSAAYAFPVLGAIIADGFLGKYRTIIFLSIVYCLGHLALALDESRRLNHWTESDCAWCGWNQTMRHRTRWRSIWFKQPHLLSKVFGWFYFSINIGAFISMLITPLLLQKYGSHWAFALPGILMFLATIVFWMGRHRFVHIPLAVKNS